VARRTATSRLAIGEVEFYLDEGTLADTVVVGQSHHGAVIALGEISTRLLWHTFEKIVRADSAPTS